ncbi:hypothetical protein JCM10212_005456 [Sporobolomyces blumeae]
MPPRRKPIKAAAAKAAPPPSSASADVADNGAQPGENRYLPKHEAELFRQVLGHYEAKEYQDGLDKAEQILKNHPDHGESLCMKGLFLCCLDQRPQGYEEIKRGVANDQGSHIVWHVYALAFRADKRWEEALDCYKKACEIEKDSLNLLTDLSTLTIHLRRYDEYVDVRRSILRTQPRFRRNWLALAVAQYLARRYADASLTLTHYENMLREMPKGDVEHGEVLLFHAQVLEDAGRFEQCLDFLTEKSGEIVDRSTYSTQRARLLLKLGRTEPALWAWELLLEENPESKEYIVSTVAAKGADCNATTVEGQTQAVQVLDTLSEKYPRSLAIRRLALDLSSGETFRSKAKAYLLSALSKGVPSLFVDVKAMYSHAEKRKVIGEIVETFRRELEEKGAIVTDEAGDDDSVESPSTYLWTLYFLASHYSAVGDQSLALSTLSVAERHTPSLPELPMLRGRILKRAGDLGRAADAMEEARNLDGQDRGLNCKSVKYLIRAGRTEEAEEVAGLFTKKDAPSPIEDLVEMQCLWILTEEGNYFLASKQYGKALRRFHQILDTFQDIEEDQYDFHAYCMRKSTLRAYVQMLRFEDKVRDHDKFVQAAKGAVEIYTKMHDDPAAFDSADRSESNGSVEKKDEKPDPLNAYVDKDPLGLELLRTAEPLVEAARFVKPLERARPRDVETWKMSFELALRSGKHLDALRALRTAHAVSKPQETASLVPLVGALAQSVNNDGEATLDASFATALKAEVSALLGGAESPAEYVATQSKDTGSRPESALAAAEAWIRLGGKDDAEKVLSQVAASPVASLEQTLRAYDLLRNLSSSHVESFRSSAAQRFPLATAFKTEQELEQSRTNGSSEGAAPREIIE